MITYIVQKVSELTEAERKEIYQLIINAGIPDHKIHEKGGGIQVKFKDLPPEAIISIHKYIQQKIEEKMERLKNFTEANDDESEK